MAKEALAAKAPLKAKRTRRTTLFPAAPFESDPISLDTELA